MLIAANAQLQEKQASLKAVEEKVAALEAALASAQTEQARLREQASVTATRLQRAAKLTSGLQEGGVRWGEEARQIQVLAAHHTCVASSVDVASTDLIGFMPD